LQDALSVCRRFVSRLVRESLMRKRTLIPLLIVVAAPPGSISSTNAASAGKIDTFHLVE